MDIKYSKDTSKTNEDFEPKFGVWYPIESAPKDDHGIIVYNGTNIYMVYWKEKLDYIGQDKVKWKSIYRGGWTDYTVEDWANQTLFEVKNVSHWMPLPPNP